MTVESSVPVTPSTAVGAVPIDTRDVVDTSGTTVKRQVTTIGDGTEAGQTLVIGADGSLTASQGAAGATPWPVAVDSLPAGLAQDATVAEVKTAVVSVLNELLAGIGVAVSNFPATQPVSGTFWQAIQPVDGTVTADQGGTWSVGVDNFPATQTVDGTVGIAGTVTVGGTVTATPPVAAGQPPTGQTKVASTGIAVPLAAQALAQGIVVQGLKGNIGVVEVGPSTVGTGTGFELQPGQSVTLPLDDASHLYVTGTAGDGVCWIGV